jgi:simple sugar transport system ATP-binding protein
MTVSKPLRPELRLELRGISKQYPGVLANDAVNLRVAAGEIHAVLGENGAGKSTLMKVIYGSVQPDAGQISFDGQAVQITSPQAARKLGVSMVFQHFSLFESLGVAENVWLGLSPTGETATLPQVAALIEQKAKAYGLDVEHNRPVHSLSVGERQRVEIVRALLTSPKLLILDEPTSVLTPQAVDKLFATLRLLSAEGCSILYISHKLHEIQALCQSCTVMRAGKVVAQCDPRQETAASLSRMMIGTEPPAVPQTDHRAGAARLEVRHFSLKADDAFGTDLQAINLSVHAGEIVGIAGVSGNGQQELMRALSGEDTRAAPNSIVLHAPKEQDISRVAPALRRNAGLCFVPEERLGRGAVPQHSLASNVLLTRSQDVSAALLGQRGLLGGWLRPQAMARSAQSIIDRLGVKASGPKAAASSLSGGNLQKFIVGRELSAKPQVLIISQPTWGVDVGAAAQIHAELIALRDAGCALLIVSEELEELFALCDRLHVIARGRLSPSLMVSDATTDVVGRWMSGDWTEELIEPKEDAHAAV